MRLGGIEKDIEITLVCRKGMLCRMLLGRTALGSDFVVDASQKYLASDLKKNLKKDPKIGHQDRAKKPIAGTVSPPKEA